MTAIVQDVQKQAIASARITLWELDLDGSFAYFHEGIQSFTQGTVNGAVSSSASVTLAAANSDIAVGQVVTGTGISGTVTVTVISSTSLTLSSAHTIADGVVLTFEGRVRFRNRTDPTNTINTYDPLPIFGEGFQWKSEGSSARPTLTVANILSTYSDALGGLTKKDILGKKLYRRTTLNKYTYSSGYTSTTPVEFPMQMYIIDRIANETPEYITLELASGFDLEGVKLPRRVITGASCPWIYTGAGPETAKKDKVGGCTWSNQGKIWVADPYGNDGTQYILFVNGANEPVVPSTLPTPDWGDGDDIEKGGVYKTANSTTMFRVTPEGISEAVTGIKDYWQYLGEDTDTSTEPSDSNNYWKRVRVYAASYSASTTYNVYSLSLYSSYVLHSNRLWRAVNVSQETGKVKGAPGFNKYWELGDVCSKSIDGCATRYRYQPIPSTWESYISGTEIISPDKSEKPLKFGGFPGTRHFS